ncbi:hypothetical protein ABW21_db0208312 [Orbilia brochopaga]|nr:hypothetical protein ABW21_db0208312 [Drechslerella brochopaga]
MPRRGLFNRASLAGLFESSSRRQSWPTHTTSATPILPYQDAGILQNPPVLDTSPINIEPIPPLPNAAQRATGVPEATYAWPDAADVWPPAPDAVPQAAPNDAAGIPDLAAVNAWLREGLLEPAEQPDGRISPEPDPFAFFRTPLVQVPRRNIFRRIFRHFFPSPKLLPPDFYAPPPRQLSWNEVRDRLPRHLPPPPPPPVHPAVDEQYWENVRLRIGVWPKAWDPRWPLVLPPGVPHGVAAAAPIMVPTPNGPVPMFPPMAPHRGAPAMVQTPHGLVSLNMAPGYPQQQPDIKQTAMVALLAGVKLVYNAASSAWDVIQMALDQTVNDKIRARDDYMAVLARFGYHTPGAPSNFPPPHFAPQPRLFTPRVPGAWV